MSNNPLVIMLLAIACFTAGICIILFGNYYILIAIMFLAQPIINWSRKQHAVEEREKKRVRRHDEREQQRIEAKTLN